MVRRFRPVLAGLAFLGSIVSLPAWGSEFGRTWFDIEPYRPSYFIVGRPDTKVQFSAKLRFVPSFPLYFGYTQLMKWQLFLASAPFRDVNYEPELFYRWHFEPEPERDDENPPPPHFLDWGVFAHESNGQDGPNSRSWDRAYLRYVNGWRVGEQAALIVSVKVNAPLRLDTTTPTFLWYRGIFEFEASWVRFLADTFADSELRLRVFTGGPSHVNPFAGGQELTLRLKPRSTTFLPTFVAQVFHGYGENMLDYDRRRFVFRVGLGF